VPIVVEMNHPMTRDHFITSVEVVNASDAAPAKGTFHFTPANGHVYLAFQAQMDPGTSEILVTAECNRHGRSSSKHKIQIDDGGGCAGGEPAVRRTDGDDVRPPVIRIAELVQSGHLHKGDLVHAQVKLRHPNRRAAALATGKPAPDAPELEPLYLERLEAYFGDEPAGRFELTAALSEDPFITFGLVVRAQKELRVVLVNNRGVRLEARQGIRFA
jgi:sulfur-oxidizing protein SoxY